MALRYRIPWSLVSTSKGWANTSRNKDSHYCNTWDSYAISPTFQSQQDSLPKILLRAVAKFHVWLSWNFETCGMCDNYVAKMWLQYRTLTTGRVLARAYRLIKYLVVIFCASGIRVLHHSRPWQQTYFKTENIFYQPQYESHRQITCVQFGMAHFESQFIIAHKFTVAVPCLFTGWTCFAVWLLHALRPKPPFII